MTNALECTQLISLHCCLIAAAFSTGKRATRVSYPLSTVPHVVFQRRHTEQEGRSHQRGKECPRSVHLFLLFDGVSSVLSTASFFPTGIHSTKGTHTVHHSLSRSPTLASLSSSSPSYWTTDVQTFLRSFCSPHCHPCCHWQQLLSQLCVSER